LEFNEGKPKNEKSENTENKTVERNTNLIDYGNNHFDGVKENKLNQKSQNDWMIDFNQARNLNNSDNSNSNNFNANFGFDFLEDNKISGESGLKYSPQKLTKEFTDFDQFVFSSNSDTKNVSTKDNKVFIVQNKINQINGSKTVESTSPQFEFDFNGKFNSNSTGQNQNFNGNSQSTKAPISLNNKNSLGNHFESSNGNHSNSYDSKKKTDEQNIYDFFK